MTSPTHEVSNQVPELVGNNLFSDDPVLTAGVQRLQASYQDPYTHFCVAKERGEITPLYNKYFVVACSC